MFVLQEFSNIDKANPRKMKYIQDVDKRKENCFLSYWVTMG